MIRRLLTFATITIFLISCAGPSSSNPGMGASTVLTSTTILADVTRNISGDRFKVESLLPVGSDPHSYQATPQDLAKISNSKLLIINGAKYEQFLRPLLENAGAKKTVVEASAGISPRTDSQRGVDPHMWLDPTLVLTYVANIRDALINIDPAGEAIYKSNADAYTTKLKELDTWIAQQVNQIPIARRLLVTNHEAFGYFAQRYGFKVVGTVIESFSSDASPSARQLAALIDQIKSSEAPAIFLDASDNSAIAQQIGNETGVRVVTDLHLESLTDGAPAATYIDMMKYNVTQIVDALK